MKKIILILIVLFGLIQFIPYGKNHTNPKVMAEPKWDSPKTKELFARGCADCHSNETKWPWYSNIAPLSWSIYHHVEEGEKQYISFIDPKGIRNSNPKNDSKMDLAISIKKIETDLGDTNIVLNSFILSNTSLNRLNELHTNLTYQFFESKNVLFQKDRKSSYVGVMFGKILG